MERPKLEDYSKHYIPDVIEVTKYANELDKYCDELENKYGAYQVKVSELYEDNILLKNKSESSFKAFKELLDDYASLKSRYDKLKIKRKRKL